MMQQGRSNDEIRKYLVDRYSNYVLYDPPLTASTWLLWFGPLLILLGGGAVVVMALRKRQRGESVVDTSINNAPTDNGDDW
jgi:cytochrome c-type biogenesis protein CcmH